MRTKTLTATLGAFAFLGLLFLANLTLAQSTSRTPNHGAAGSATPSTSNPSVTKTDRNVASSEATLTTVTFPDGTAVQMDKRQQQVYASRPAVAVDVNHPEMKPEAMQAWIAEFDAWFFANPGTAERSLSTSERKLLGNKGALYAALHKQALLDAKRATDQSLNAK